MMEEKAAKILLVEDDLSLAKVVRDYLKISGYQVSLAHDGKSGWEAYQQELPDICVLDVMMPERDGYSLAELIRKNDASTPILFLTARGLEEDRLKGFEIGADDYIVKPFSIEELVMRIKVFLKRSKNQVLVQLAFPIGSYHFDRQNLVLIQHSVRTPLTQMEADLLYQLCASQNALVKRELLLTRVWGNDNYFTGRSLDVFISRLRKYLKDDPRVEIQNVHAVGFRLMVKGE